MINLRSSITFFNKIFLRASSYRIHRDKEARIVFHHRMGWQGAKTRDGDNDNSRATTLSGMAVGRVAKGDGTALSCSLFIVSALLPLGSLSRLSTTSPRQDGIPLSLNQPCFLAPISSCASLVTSRGSHFH